VTKVCWSRRIIIVASVLFLLIVLPADSQIPTASRTPPRPPGPRIFNEYRTPLPRRDNRVGPAIPFRPPITDTIVSPANEIILAVNPPTVEVDQLVTFEIIFKPPLKAPQGLNVQYHFDFGDRSPGERTKNRQTTHAYRSPGRYPVYAEISTPEGFLAVRPLRTRDQHVDVRPKVIQQSPTRPPLPSPYFPSGPIATAVPRATPSIRRTPTATLEVYLSVDKNPSSVGKTVTFSIWTNKNKPYLYELNFGDNSRPFQTRSNSVWHIFKAPGKYIVSARVLDDRSRPSANLEIFVDGGPPPWIYVILVVLGVVALRYLLRRKPTPKPPPIPPQPPPIPALPTFHLHWDRDSPQKQQENVTVNYELHFDPNLSKGRRRLETGGTSLIISKKKKQ